MSRKAPVRSGDAPAAAVAGAASMHGTVKGRDGATWLVAGEGGLVRAPCARSCLAEPQLGDRVLVTAEGDEAYILAILAGPGEVRIAVEGGLTIAAGRQLSLESPQIVTRAEEADFRIARLKVSSLRLEATFEHAKMTVERLHALATDLLAEIGNSVRRVAGLEQVSAGQLDHRAKDTASLHARFTSVTADKDVRIDGDQIHMG